MAPVTASSTGVARQTIDDPNLIALIERLSKFDPHDSSVAGDVPVADAAVVAGSATNAVITTTSFDTNAAADGDVSMTDAANNNSDSHGDPPVAIATVSSTAGESVENKNKPPSPPLDVDGLVAELDSVAKWRFQELVRD